MHTDCIVGLAGFGADDRRGLSVDPASWSIRVLEARDSQGDIAFGKLRRILQLGRGCRLDVRGLSSQQADALGCFEERSSEAPLPARLTVLVRRAQEHQRARLFLDDTIPLRWECRGDGLEIAGRHFFGSVARRPSGKLDAELWTFWESAGEFNDAVTNFTRVAIALGWAHGKTVLLHSCAVAGASGRVDLFFGTSGAGKSTLGTLALRSGRLVLSDDLNSIDLDLPGAPVVQGFPWTGDHGPRSWTEVRSGEIGAIYKLEKAPCHEVVPMSKARAVAGLAACSPFVNSEPTLYDALVPLLTDLVERVPVYTLRFSVDEGVWDLVDQTARRAIR